MKISEAKALLQALSYRRDSHSSASILSQLPKLFVPKLIGSGVTTHDSLHGRLLLVLYRHKTRKIQDNHVKKVFARAVQAIQGDLEFFNKHFPLLKTRMDLIRLAQEQGELSTTSRIAYPEAPELNGLQVASIDQTQKVKPSFVRHDLSLIHFDNGSTEAPDASTLGKLFEQSKYPDEFTKALETFLKTHQEYRDKYMDERLYLLQQGKARNAQIMRDIFPENAPQLSEEHVQALKKTTERLSLEMELLDSGESWMYSSHYGKQASALETMASIFSKLPPQLTEGLPAPILSALQNGQLPDALPVILNAVQAALKSSCEHLPDVAALLNNPLVSALLPNESRALTGSMSKLLPPSVREGIESWMQQGLAGNWMEFESNEETRNMVLTAAKAGSQIRTEGNLQTVLENASKDVLNEYVQKPLDQVGKSGNDLLFPFIDKLGQMIPAPILELTGIKTGVSFGLFSLEVVGQSDGKFSLYVYSTGQALQYHPQDSKGNVQWPMVLTNISKKSLNPDFFYRLLTLHTEGRRSETFSSRPQDIFGPTGLLSLLGGSQERHGSFVRADSGITSESYMQQLTMLRPDTFESAIFEMQLQHTVSYCRQYLKEGRLTIPDQEACTSIEKAYEHLSKAFTKSISISKPKHMIKATLDEMQDAIKCFRQQEQVTEKTDIFSEGAKLPSPLLEKMAQLLSAQGISQDSIESHKATICWALGDEFEPLVEALSEAVAAAPPSPQQPTTAISTLTVKKSVPAIQKAPRGWLGSIIVSTYVQVALSAFQFVLLMSKMVNAGLGLLLNSTVRWALWKIIPSSIQRWYAAFMGEVQRRMIDLTLHVILHFFLNPKDAKNLKDLAHSWRSSIHTVAGALTGTQELNLQLNAPLQNPVAVVGNIHPLLNPTQVSTVQSYPKVEGASSFGDISFPPPSYALTADELSTLLYVWNGQINELAKKEKIANAKLVKAYQTSSIIPLLIQEQVKCLFSQEDKFWDQLPDPETWLKRLMEISFHLIDPQISGGNIVASMTSFYSLLYITDRLARRDPNAHLDGYRINITPLLQWLRKNDTPIGDPIVVENLCRICHYFAPEIDLNHIPDDEALRKYASTSLFDYSCFSYTSGGKQVCFTDKPPHEAAYLKERLKDPEVLKKLTALGIDIKQLHPYELLQVMFNESSYFNRGEASPINFSYAMLRYQKMICASFAERALIHIRSYGTMNSMTFAGSANFATQFLAKPPKDYKDRFKKKSVWQNFISFEWKNIRQRVTRPLIIPKKMSHLFASNYHYYDPNERKPQTQSNYITKSLYHSQWRGKTKSLQERQKDSFECEASHRILHGLTFFKEHLSRYSHYLYGDLKSALLSPFALPKQLEKSPQLARALGEFLTDMLEDTSKESMFGQAVLLTIDIQRYFRHFCPQHLSLLPDLISYTNKKLPHHAPESADYHLLHAFSFDQPPEQKEGRFEAAMAIYQALFVCNAYRLFAYSSSLSSNEDFIFRLRIKFYQWMPTLRKLLEEGQTRTLLINSVLKCFAVSCPENARWEIATADETPAGWKFTYNFIQIDFFRGLLTVTQSSSQTKPGADSLHQKVSSTREMRKLKEDLRYAQSFAAESQELQVVRPGFFQTADETLSVDTSQTDYVVARKRVDHKFYRYIPNPWPPADCQKVSRELALLSAKEQNESITWDIDTVQFWLEESFEPNKELLCYHPNRKLFHRLPVRQVDKTLLLSCDSAFIRLEPAALRELHLSFGRFCPSSEIQCFGNKNVPHLTKLQFTSFNLEFSVEKENETLRAFSTTFAGYYIAPKQMHKHLDRFPSYLLLCNRQGEHKVLVPADDYFKTGVWRHLSILGPIGTMIHNAMSHSAPTSQKKYACYDLNTAGELSSDTPLDLAYLISLHLLQNDNEAAYRVCTKLELICTRTHVPQNILQQLYPLFLPSLPAFAFVRKRVLAALEQSRLLHNQREEEVKSTDAKGKNQISHKIKEASFESFEILSLINLIVDLSSPSSADCAITDYQEWLLHSRIQYCASRLIKEQGEAIPSTVLDHLLFSMGPLAARHEQLKKKYATSSLLSKVGRFCGDVLQAPSVTPPEMVLTLAAPLSAPISFNSSNEMVAIGTMIFSFLWKDGNLLSNKQLLYNPLTKTPPLAVHAVTNENFKAQFLSYYLIARGKGTPEQAKELKTLLSYIRGGWDAESRLMIHLLEYVCAFPLLYWPPEKIIAILLRPTDDHNIASFNNFLHHLRKVSASIETLSRGGEVVGKTVCNGLISKALNGSNPVAQFSPIPLGFISPAIFWASKTFNAVKSRMSTTLQIPKVQPLHALAHLAEEDRRADTVLSEFFDIAFEEVFPEQEQKQAFEEFSISSSSSAEDDRMTRLNQSIRDYYARPDRSQVFLRLKSQERLSALYIRLLDCCTQLRSDLEQEQRQILEPVQTVLASSSRQLQFIDLVHFFLKGHFRDRIELAKLPVSMLERLNRLLPLHLARYTRLQQLDRALEQLNGLTSCKDKEAFEQRVEQLADELQARRRYNFSELPAATLRRLIVFEFVTNKMLWKKQIAAVAQMSDDMVLELLMSLGKTFFFIPTATSLLGDSGKRLVFNIWPDAMYGTNVRLGSAQSHQVFNQHVYALNFNRERRSFAHYEAIISLFRHAVEEGHPIHMRRTDAMALRLMFIDLLYTASKATSHQELNALKEIIAKMAQILHFIRFEGGTAIGDEAHEVFSNKQELCYPIGSESILPENTYRVIEQCLRALMSHESLRKMIYAADLDIVNFYESTGMRDLAEKMCGYWKFKISDSQKQEFIDYVTKKSTHIPKWISQHERFQEIAVVKSVLSIFLPLVFKRVINVDFGASKQEGVAHAKPYAGNDKVREESSFSEPIEALVKTAIMLLHKPLEPAQIDGLIVHLAERDSKDRKAQGTSHHTQVQKFFEQITGSSALLANHKNWSSAEKQKVYTAMARHPEAMFLYLRHYSWPSIKFWKYSIRCNALNFASMFQFQLHDTGTPFNDGSYPDHLKMLWDPGTTGEALHIIKKKCPSNGIHLLNQTDPSRILDEVLERFFVAKSQFTALIDGGAQLRGLSNLEVAKRMLQHAKRHHPEIQAIDFFMENPIDAAKEPSQGKEKAPELLMTLMMVGDTVQLVPADQCNLPLTARLAYFDQVHGFAANIPQSYNGKGLLLVGPNHTLYNFLQQLFRMRGVKNFKRLLEELLSQVELDHLNQNERQSVHIAMTREVADLIRKMTHATSSTGMPTLEQLISFFTKNEAQMVAEDNYDSYRKKVNNVVQQAVLDKILKTSNVFKMIEYFRKAINILIFTYEEDPAKAFGMIDVSIPVEQALTTCREQAMDQLHKTGLFSKAELETYQKTLHDIKKPPMPEKVQAFSDGETLHTDKLDHLNREVIHTQSQEQEAEKAREQDKEMQKEMQKETQNDQMLPKTSSRFTEWGWGGLFNIRSISWLRFTDTSPLNLSFISRQLAKIRRQFAKLRAILDYVRQQESNEGPPPLFNTGTLLKDSADPALNKIASLVDRRIWCTNNFVPRITQYFGDSTIEVGSFLQRDLKHVLIHFEDDGEVFNILSMGCLSMHDAAVLQEKIKKEQQTKRTTETLKKVMLYNPILRIQIAGDEVDVNRLRNNHDLRRLEAQVRFLNGDTLYPPEQSQSLFEWVAKAGAEDLETAFRGMHQKRGKRPFAGSDIETVFNKAKGIPDEEYLSTL
ncbi:MAG: DUF3638 domain-containing protein [Parachlamydiaceae bacterium]|nr:DUF3638 domain-containing protein [Parachlamydiaceae bacterium]